jgi:hypothetical protein
MHDDQNESDGRWVATEFGPVWKTGKPVKKGLTPEGKLKKACREALSNWKHRTGIYAKLISYSVGHFKTRDGARSYKLGTDGTGDMLIGLLGCTLMVETKVPGRSQSESQKEMQADWERTGQPYALVYKPTDLTDALDQIAAQHGKLF